MPRVLTAVASQSDVSPAPVDSVGTAATLWCVLFVSERARYGDKRLPFLPKSVYEFRANEKCSRHARELSCIHFVFVDTLHNFWDVQRFDTFTPLFIFSSIVSYFINSSNLTSFRLGSIHWNHLFLTFAGKFHLCGVGKTSW